MSEELKKEIKIHQSRCCAPETWLGTVNGKVVAEMKVTDKNEWRVTFMGLAEDSPSATIVVPDDSAAYKLLRRYMNGFHDENNPRVCTSGSCQK